MLVVATLSTEALDQDPVLAERIAAMEARGAVQIPVSRLTLDESVQLLVEGHGLHPSLAHEIAPQANGNLTFLTLMVRDLAARGHLCRGPEGRLGLVDGVRPSALTASDLDALCLQRVDAIRASDDPDAVAETLASTALAGPEPPVQVVRAINQEGLDGLVATGLVRQQGRRLAFEHRSIRRAAERIAADRADRGELHRRLADAWEELGRYTGADVTFPLGRHRLRAGDPDRALVPLLRSTRRALRGAAPPRPPRRAARHRGRRRDGDPDGSRRVSSARGGGPAGAGRGACRAGAGPGGPVAGSGRPPEPREPPQAGGADRVRPRRARGGPQAPRRRLRHLRGDPGLERHGPCPAGARRGVAGRGPASDAAYARALRLGRGAEASDEVRALRGLVECRIEAGQMDPSSRISRLRRVARESGDTRNIAQATCRGLVHLRRRRLDLADRHFQTALALAATLGDDRLRLRCENNRGEVLRYREDYKGAWQAYDRAARLAAARGWRVPAGIARLNLALVELRESRPAAAGRQVDAADALLQDHARHWGWMVVGLVRSLLAATQGMRPGVAPGGRGARARRRARRAAPTWCRWSGSPPPPRPWMVGHRAPGGAPQPPTDAGGPASGPHIRVGTDPPGGRVAAVGAHPGRGDAETLPHVLSLGNRIGGWNAPVQRRLLLFLVPVLALAGCPEPVVENAGDPDQLDEGVRAGVMGRTPIRCPPPQGRARPTRSPRAPSPTPTSTGAHPGVARGWRVAQGHPRL